MSALSGILIVALAAGAAGEHLYRRAVQRTHGQAVAARETLERQFTGLLINQEQIKSDLTLEQHRSRVFARELQSKDLELERALARLHEEHRTVRGLEAKMAAMGRQLDQLQGELAVALEDGRQPSASRKPGTVELERVIVSRADASNLQGRVISVHPEWDFIVVDLGWDRVQIGDVISVFRQDRLTAKARVDRVQEQVCAATVLPQWRAEQVQVNDVIRAL